MRINKINEPQGVNKKKYVYFNQLQLSDKTYDQSEAGSSAENDEKENLDGKIETPVDVYAETPAPGRSSPPSRPRSIKRKQPEEAELEILRAIEENRSSKMSFFHSVLPHVNKFTDQQFLLFQEAVLRVIARINHTNESIYRNPATFFTGQLPTYYQSTHASAIAQSGPLFNGYNRSPFYATQSNIPSASSTVHQESLFRTPGRSVPFSESRNLNQYDSETEGKIAVNP